MKEKISNIPLLRTKRRMLRKEATPQEIILWSRLRNGQLGYKFRRQHSFGNYIADFYCPEKKLIVEVDGSQYADKERYDAERTKFLGGKGLHVVRFWNNEISTNLEGAITEILEALE